MLAGGVGMCYTESEGREWLVMPDMDMIRRVVNGLKTTYALQSVDIFGSYAEGRATAQSDLDLLVEFETPGVSLIRLNALKYDLEDALGLPVDVIHAPLPADSMIKPRKVVRVL